MNKRIKQISFSIMVAVSLTTLMVIPVAIESQDEALTVSIIDADYPPFAFIHEDDNVTFYEIDLVYQVENPTDTDIRVDYACAPYPFPYLRTNLANKSIVVSLGYIIEWVEGTWFIPPGITNDTYIFAIIVEDYAEETLPVGEYSLWFDYTNCSIVPLPVIVEKLIISVTENNMTYFFEHDNREDIYTFEATHSGLYGLITVLILATFVQRKRKKNS
ncbi:MAG: hypothetical protein ACTSQ4_05815 [Candidatus Heimdallarchaeaceae archaeon]